MVLNVQAQNQNSAADNSYTVNNLCGVDEYGRTFSTMSGTKEDKSVGMFYFIWLGQHPGQMTGLYDNTRIMADDNGDGMKNLFNKQGTDISPLDKFHYWGEPLYDYYNSGDDYVIRKHIEMLTIAGVDYLVFDVTNGYTYNNIWMKILQILNEYQQQGWNVPKVAFYTNSYSEQTMVQLYNVLYQRNIYPNTWYKPDGKRPLIIGKFDNEPAAGMESKLRDFFYFRTSQWPDERVHSSGDDTTVFHPDGFPWIDWQKPQRLYKDIINVSVAQHPMLPFSDSYLLGSKNWGRGFEISPRLNDSIPSTGSLNYRSTPGKNDTSKIRTGANFEQEWKLALKADPPNVFVTGWNQWVAIKQIIEAGTANERIVFVDSFNEEYSWDIEPMKGGYNDAYFIQLIQNVRKYKGISGSPAVKDERTIDITGAPAQWDNVKNVYRSIGNKNYGRDYAAFAVTKYTMEAPENNLQEIRVTNDRENIYLYISSENNITGYSKEKTNWMNIFIGTGTVKKQGWEGYNYAVNRSREAEGKAEIEKLDSTGRGEKTGIAEYSISGNIMQVKIPREALSLTDSTMSIYFKVSDGVEKPGEIMDYYVSGKSLPMGRLSYVYSNSGVTGVSETGKVSKPEKYNLQQNYPNPFNPETEIEYGIAEAGKVTLKVYNLLGEEVSTLVNQEQEAGKYKVKFNGSGLASGTYLYRLNTNNYSYTKKMTFLK
jgi:hypothetical protein